MGHNFVLRLAFQLGRSTEVEAGPLPTARPPQRSWASLPPQHPCSPLEAWGQPCRHGNSRRKRAAGERDVRAGVSRGAGLAEEGGERPVPEKMSSRDPLPALALGPGLYPPAYGHLPGLSLPPSPGPPAFSGPQPPWASEAGPLDGMYYLPVSGTPSPAPPLLLCAPPSSLGPSQPNKGSLFPV